VFFIIVRALPPNTYINTITTNQKLMCTT
jgi:hypothetical protein